VMGCMAVSQMELQEEDENRVKRRKEMITE
jgi:hypothetical protein